jgi:hypothetical protein
MHSIYIDRSFQSWHLNDVSLTEIKYTRFLQKKISRKRVIVQGEKARHIPQLLCAQVEEAEVAPTAKNGREVIHVSGSPEANLRRQQNIESLYICNEL